MSAWPVRIFISMDSAPRTCCSGCTGRKHWRRRKKLLKFTHRHQKKRKKKLNIKRKNTNCFRLKQMKTHPVSHFFQLSVSTSSLFLQVLEEDGVQWLHIGNGWLPPMVEVPYPFLTEGTPKSEGHVWLPEVTCALVRQDRTDQGSFVGALGLKLRYPEPQSGSVKQWNYVILLTWRPNQHQQ